MYDYYDNDDSYGEQDDNILEAGNDESQGYGNDDTTNDDTTNDDSDNVVEAQSNDDNVVEAQGNDNVVETQGSSDNATTPHISILGHQISFEAAGFDCYCTGGCLCKRYAPKSTFDTDCFYCDHHLSDHTKR